MTLHDVRQAAWRDLREAVEFEREHGPSWQVAMAMQDRTRDLVRILSVPENTPVVERTAEGLQVVS